MPDNPVRVLLVEDDPEDYEIARRLFAAIDTARYRVEWVATYDEALAAMARQEHDVYLLDYRLGARTGVELLQAARERGWRQPAIMLTGQEDRETDLEAMRGGADDYLTKGRINAELLERALRYALERGRAARALRESELRLRGVFEATRDALLITDGEGHYCVEANPAACALFGLTRDEMIGRTLESFAPPGAPPQAIWQATAVGSQVKGEMRLVRRDGSHRSLEFVVTPDFLPGYDLSVLRDVTESRPREGAGPGAAEPHALPAPRGQSDDGPPDLNQLVASLAEALLRRLGEAIELTLVFDSAAKPLAVEAGLVEQVVLALAAGAQSAMPVGGKLTVETGAVEVAPGSPRIHPELRPGKYAVIKLRDTGRGADDQARAVDAEDGSGLPAAYRLVRQSGGVVAVYGEPGVGTCRMVYLPRADTPATKALPPPPQSPHLALRAERSGFFGAVLRWLGGPRVSE